METKLNVSKSELIRALNSRVSLLAICNETELIGEDIYEVLCNIDGSFTNDGFKVSSKEIDSENYGDGNEMNSTFHITFVKGEDKQSVYACVAGTYSSWDSNEWHAVCRVYPKLYVRQEYTTKL